MKFSVAVLGADPSLVARLTAAAGKKLAPILDRRDAAGTGIGSPDDLALASASRTADTTPSLDDNAAASLGDAVDPSPDT